MKKLAICLYKFFPFGGLARDAVRILSICRQHGYQIKLFVMECHGDIPDGFDIEVIEAKGLTNHQKVASYIEQVKTRLADDPYDLIVGFNKIPGLDLYYAADPCYIDRVKNQVNYSVMRFSPRVKFYSYCEDAVFNRTVDTVALMISDVQRDLFKQHYATPDERLIMLPPGIDPNRKRPDDWQQQRQYMRQELNVTDDEFLLLMVGTGFKTKGVDRSIAALAALPARLKDKTRLFIVGEGETAPYDKQARGLGVSQQVTFFGGRSDVPQFLLAADLLLHPARKENTGTVILEAIVAGLPAMVSEVCGYAHHVQQAASGLLLSSPFQQDEFDLKLITMLENKPLVEWSENALAYAANEDLYSMPDKAAAIIEQMAIEKRAKEGKEARY